MANCVKMFIVDGIYGNDNDCEVRFLVDETDRKNSFVDIEIGNEDATFSRYERMFIWNEVEDDITTDNFQSFKKFLINCMENYWENEEFLGCSSYEDVMKYADDMCTIWGGIESIEAKDEVKE